MTEMLTIESYLRGLTGFVIPDEAIATILLKRSIPSGVDASELEEKERDLATADLYMWCASTPSVKNSTEDADGDWRHVEGGWQSSAYDKRELRAMAREIYAKYAETTTTTRTIKIINL